MTQKTPVQHFIKYLNEMRKDLPFEYEAVIDIILLKEDEFLEKERQAIMQVYADGLGNGQHFERGDALSSVLDEKKYYNETFNTKENV